MADVLAHRGEEDAAVSLEEPRSVGQLMLMGVSEPMPAHGERILAAARERYRG
jgi:hypothetical protein